MIWASHCIRDRCENIDSWGNCIKPDVGQIFGIEHATDDLLNYLQDNIFLWIFILVHVGLTEKYLSNRMKLLLNSEPLSKINLRRLGYPDSHTPLNIWDIIAEYWSMIDTSAISNHPVSGSIKVMNSNWSSFVNILLSGCLTLASIVYVPMRSTHTVWHGVKVSASLAGSNPYLALPFLNFWQYLQVLQSFCDWSTIMDHLQTVVNVWEILSPPGCWR